MLFNSKVNGLNIYFDRIISQDGDRVYFIDVNIAPLKSFVFKLSLSLLERLSFGIPELLVPIHSPIFHPICKFQLCLKGVVLQRFMNWPNIVRIYSWERLLIAVLAPGIQWWLDGWSWNLFYWFFGNRLVFSLLWLFLYRSVFFWLRWWLF